MLQLSLAGRAGRDAQYKQTQGEVLPPSELARYLRVDATTGQLFWLPRANLNKRLWDAPALNRKHTGGYRTGVILQRVYYAHRVVFAMATGRWPDGQIDHINGDKADNRFANLREVTPSENHRNMPRPANNTSGTVGVYWNARLRKWGAQIKCDGRVIHLGTFAAESDAVAARKAAERDLGFHINHGKREAA